MQDFYELKILSKEEYGQDLPECPEEDISCRLLRVEIGLNALADSFVFHKDNHDDY